MVKNDKLDLLEGILSKINSSVSPQEVLNYLIDKCIEITGALTGSIMIINLETKVLEIRVSKGLHPARVANTQLKLGEGVTGQVALTGTPLLIRNVDEVDFYIRIMDDLKSELAVPLKLEDKTIGVISVDSNEVGKFTPEHAELLEMIASFAAQILHKAILIETLKDKITKQNILLKVARILEEGYEVSDMFAKIMTTLSEAMTILRGMLVLHSKDDELKVFSGYKLSEEAMERGVYQIGEGIIGKVYKYGQSITIKNISENKEFLNKMKIWRGKGEKISFFAIPIKYENKVVGVVSLEKKYTSEEDFDSTLELTSLLATLVSNKVHNYVKSQREKNVMLKKNIELKERLLEQEKDFIFIGKNRKILDILETVNLISDTDATVLITGETGTGKEILAHLIHQKSKRWEKPFVSINCAAIPETLLESELFGFKKGAFTGADKEKKGKFLLAQGGTLFLDEIGDLNPGLQAKILRVLQDKMIEPLGSETQIHVDVRIISATNKNLKELTDKGEFREDLFYRLNVIHIDLPSLGSRKDDIQLFVDHFIRIYNKKYSKNIDGLSPRCIEILSNYDWPGNIRELQNVIERAVILVHGESIDVQNLPPYLLENQTERSEDRQLENLIEREIATSEKGEVYKKVVDKIEKFIIEYALIQHNNKQIEAADYLGIHRNTLHQKIKKYGM
jgi:Nif-specific regulatory protein